MKGVRDDGRPKVRPIVHMTESLVNASTEQPEKLGTDTLDRLYEATRELKLKCKASSLYALGVAPTIARGRRCLRSTKLM